MKTLVIFLFTLSAHAFWRPIDNQAMNYGSQKLCESRSQVECVQCPREGMSTGCIDYAVVDNIVDDPSKPIYGFVAAQEREVLECDDLEQTECESTTELFCNPGFSLQEGQCYGILRYEQKVVGKKLQFDEALYLQRIAALEAQEEESRQKRQHDERVQAAQKFLIEQMIRNEQGQYLPEEAWKARARKLIQESDKER